MNRALENTTKICGKTFAQMNSNEIKYILTLKKVEILKLYSVLYTIN